MTLVNRGFGLRETFHVTFHLWTEIILIFNFKTDFHFSFENKKETKKHLFFHLTLFYCVCLEFLIVIVSFLVFFMSIQSFISVPSVTFAHCSVCGHFLPVFHQVSLPSGRVLVRYCSTCFS